MQMRLWPRPKPIIPLETSAFRRGVIRVIALNFGLLLTFVAASEINLAYGYNHYQFYLCILTTGASLALTFWQYRWLAAPRRIAWLYPNLPECVARRHELLQGSLGFWPIFGLLYLVWLARAPITYDTPSWWVRCPLTFAALLAASGIGRWIILFALAVKATAPHLPYEHSALFARLAGATTDASLLTLAENQASYQRYAQSPKEQDSAEIIAHFQRAARAPEITANGVILLGANAFTRQALSRSPAAKRDSPAEARAQAALFAAVANEWTTHSWHPTKYICLGALIAPEFLFELSLIGATEGFLINLPVLKKLDPDPTDLKRNQKLSSASKEAIRSSPAYRHISAYRRSWLSALIP